MVRLFTSGCEVGVGGSVTGSRSGKLSGSEGGVVSCLACRGSVGTPAGEELMVHSGMGVWTLAGGGGCWSELGLAVWLGESWRVKSKEGRSAGGCSVMGEAGGMKLDGWMKVCISFMKFC